MKMSVRQRQSQAAPGVRGTARVDRRAATVLHRVREGEIAVLDHLDMDRATAHALVDAGVAGVVNASAMTSGRFPNLGPEVLVGAGVAVVDSCGTGIFSAVKDGAALRLRDGEVYVGDRAVAAGRAVDADVVRADLDAARAGLQSQLESFTHNSTEFLRREQDVLLHGKGLPRTRTAMAGRPVVVVLRNHDWESELKAIKPFIREQDPVLIGVDRGADALRDAGHQPHVVVLAAAEPELPALPVLRKADDVVAILERGASHRETERLDRAGVSPVRFDTGATPEDAALLIADAAGASLIVGVGMHATLDEFLDRGRGGLASTYLTRLKVGPRLVDAAAVPSLYDGSVRPRHLLAVTVAGLAALAAAIGVTPVGQEWADALVPAVREGWTTVVDRLRGLF